jgi:hypothetical protein
MGHSNKADCVVCKSFNNTDLNALDLNMYQLIGKPVVLYHTVTGKQDLKCVQGIALLKISESKKISDVKTYSLLCSKTLISRLDKQINKNNGMTGTSSINNNNNNNNGSTITNNNTTTTAAISFNDQIHHIVTKKNNENGITPQFILDELIKLANPANSYLDKTIQDVNAALTHLSDEGYIYTGIDDEHFLSSS